MSTIPPQSGRVGVSPHRPDWHQPVNDISESDLYDLWRRRVVDSDNDFIVVISAASKSAVSGVGKTTLAIQMARLFDRTASGFDATSKSTLDPGKFSRELLASPDVIDDGSAVIFDEGQGTLSDDGADARRSMASSVIDVTKALSTMRFRQFTSIIVTQSTKWIDKRVDEILDALVLIQPRGTDGITAQVFDTYYNDIELGTKRYTESVGRITWPPLRKSDPDYEYLHDLKEKSATGNLSFEAEEDDEPEIPKERRVQLAQKLYSETEMSQSKIGDIVDRTQQWVSQNTKSTES